MPRLSPVRSPARMRPVAHCIVNELVTRRIVTNSGSPMRVDELGALGREDRQRRLRVEVGREERREEHHLARDEEHHPEQGGVHAAALHMAQGELGLTVVHRSGDGLRAHRVSLSVAVPVASGACEETSGAMPRGSPVASSCPSIGWPRCSSGASARISPI